MRKFVVVAGIWLVAGFGECSDGFAQQAPAPASAPVVDVRDGTANWEYALARTNPFALKAWCDDTRVWSQERIQTVDPDLPYFNSTIGPFPRKED